MLYCRLMRDAQLNVYNYRQMRGLAPEPYEFIRFDPNNDCNIHCAYCQNHRSKETVPSEELQGFLDENVEAIQNFQVGCVMEPTLDRRLGDLLLLIGQSRTRPQKQFILQTNGILLHMHDAAKFREAGLTALSVSIDAADAETHKRLRGGTSISKVAGNLARLRKSCPSVEVVFITTVTRMNIGVMENLVEYGRDLGVRTFYMREVFHDLDSTVVSHDRMRDLVLFPGEFRRFAEDLTATVGRHAHLVFSSTDDIVQFDSKMIAASLR